MSDLGSYVVNISFYLCSILEGVICVIFWCWLLGTRILEKLLRALWPQENTGFIFVFCGCHNKWSRRQWLKTPLICDTTVEWVRSSGAQRLTWTLHSGFTGRMKSGHWLAELSPEGFGEDSTSKLTGLVGRVPVRAAAGLRSSMPWRTLQPPYPHARDSILNPRAPDLCLPLLPQQTSCSLPFSAWKGSCNFTLGPPWIIQANLSILKSPD